MTGAILNVMFALTKVATAALQSCATVVFSLVQLLGISKCYSYFLAVNCRITSQTFGHMKDGMHMGKVNHENALADC